jgi:hypothetical protein
MNLRMKVTGSAYMFEEKIDGIRLVLHAVPIFLRLLQVLPIRMGFLVTLFHHLFTARLISHAALGKLI